MLNQPVFNHVAFAAGFKEVCASHNVQVDLLLKIAETRHRATQSEPHGAQIPQTAEYAAGVAMGMPAKDHTPGIGEIMQRLNAVGMYGAPMSARQPFGS
jgi:hypothetical protein